MIKHLILTIIIFSTQSFAMGHAGDHAIKNDKHKRNHTAHADVSSKKAHAVAVIIPTKGNNISGQFDFYQESKGTRVSAVVSGLTPNSQHGVHIHQYGDISDETGLSAGGHYNPDGNPHGLPPSNIRHAGAFGNISADENGVAKFEFFDETISITGKHNPILGRSVVIHANRDDGGQPSGNAGPRIGVGVIGLAK